jgi:opacity protein-like surface antigen
MKTTYLLMAAAAAAVAVSNEAGAQTADNRFYASVFGGVETFDDESITGANAAAQARTINVEFGDGSIFGVAAGVSSADHSMGRFRAEFETAFRQADVEALSLNGVPRQFNPSSEVSITTAMVNAFYDTPVFWERVRAYGGVGFGLANVDHEIRYLVANAAATGGNLQILIPSSESTYAYQLVLGSEIELSPSWSLTGDVRYLDVGDTQVERYIGNTIINGTATNNGTLDSATVGLRYRF